MSENNVHCYDFDGFRLDITNYQLLENGETISLTQKSFELLQFLVENRGRILKKEELLDSLWEGNFVEEANLTQHIYMLRKALKQKERNKKYIETIPKNGYRFLAEVEEVNLESVHISSNGKVLEKSETEHFLNNTYKKEYVNNIIPNTNEYSQLITDHDQNEVKNNYYSKKYFAILTILSLCFVSFITYSYNSTPTDNASVVNSSKSYAVLPFKQIEGEKDEKLGIGVADVLIAKLANIEEISVRPTTSIMRFANEDNSDLANVGEKLKVDFIIAGTIQRDNGNVRVTTQLYSVRDKKQIWTETMDERYSDIFTLQDKISEKVARKVSSGLNIHSSALPYRQYTKNIEAYQAYSMGLSYWNMHTREGFEKAIPQFNKAIKKDPNFTLAYAYLADTYAHTGHLEHFISVEDARSRAEQKATKALELDANCAEALAALALVYANQNKQSEAFKLMKKSIEIKPNDAHSRHRIAWMYANRGNIEQAVNEMKIAKDLDPQSAYINMFLGNMLYYSTRYDEAIAVYRSAIKIEPTYTEPRFWIIKSLEQQGKFDEAKKELNIIGDKNINKNESWLILQGRIFARVGKKQQAKEIIQKILTNKVNNYYDAMIAQNLIALGENEKALRIMKKVIAEVQDNIYFIKYEPNYNPIRDNEQFIKLLKEKEDSQGWIS